MSRRSPPPARVATQLGERPLSEPSPLDRFRMRAAVERSGHAVPRGTADPLASSPPAAGPAGTPPLATQPGDAVLTRAEVAQMLRLSTKTVARLVERDGLPAARIGREYRFRRSAVVAWLARRESGSHFE